MCRELPHDVFFAVNKERAFHAGLLLPSQQLRLVGMGGETINGIDASPNNAYETLQSLPWSTWFNCAPEVDASVLLKVVQEGVRT